MQQLRACMFHTVVRWHKLGEVENKHTVHNSIVLAIAVPKIIEISENLTKLWQKQFCCFFIETVYIAVLLNPSQSYEASPATWNNITPDAPTLTRAT